MSPHSARVSARGAATIEAILALFTFIIVWAGVHHMGGLYAAQLEDQAQARKCAWLISVGGCTGEVEGCTATRGSGNAADKDRKLIESGDDASKGNGLLADLVRGALSDQLTSLFGSRAVAHAGQDHRRPSVLGGGETTTSASYSLPCNTKNETLGDVATSAMKDLIGGKQP